MSTKSVLTVLTIALGLSAGYAFAESEGNGNPFPFQASPQLTAGRVVVTDVGSAAYPEPMGSTAQQSGLAPLAPAAGSEASVQTPGSLPRGFSEGSVMYAQSRSVNRYLTNRLTPARYLEAGAGQPRS